MSGLDHLRRPAPFPYAISIQCPGKTTNLYTTPPPSTTPNPGLALGARILARGLRARGARGARAALGRAAAVDVRWVRGPTRRDGMEEAKGEAEDAG